MEFALCNEVLQPLGFAQQCAFAAKLGYAALEVAPFTLADDPMRIGDAQAREFRRIAEDAGLEVSGLHWLLVAPAGLSISSGDDALRMRTLGVMMRLVELCALMGGKYLVHGSPKQRSTPEGSTREQAFARVTDAFARVAPFAQQHGVTYCIEPLSTRETDVINTVAQAAKIVDEVNSPALKTMIDCSAAGQVEQEPVPALIERWVASGHVAHVQVNDPNRRAPGQGDMRFGPVLAAIERMREQGHYKGTVAVEPFDYVPDGPGCAAWSIGYLKGLAEGTHA
jgi:sugar phosphate isomerase/epimerase